jgi:hypothetical protein
MGKVMGAGRVYLNGKRALAVPPFLVGAFPPPSPPPSLPPSWRGDHTWARNERGLSGSWCGCLVFLGFFIVLALAVGLSLLGWLPR